MDERFKILPMVALGALVLLAVKSMDLWTDIKRELSAVSSAQAGEEASKVDAYEEEQGSDEKQDSGNKDTDPPKEDSYGDEEQNKSQNGKDHNKKDRASNEKNNESDLINDPALMSKSEVKVLQSLSDRREALNDRKRDLDMQTKLLRAAEKRISGRIAELKTLEQRVETMFAEQEAKEKTKKAQLTAEQEKQIGSLVKVYETMKAKDAARIFDRLDDDILVQVAKRMREAKVAAILAKMQPESAQKLTVLLAATTAQSAGDTES